MQRTVAGTLWTTSRLSVRTGWPLLLVALVLATRLPFMSANLFYWDSVHFALALDDFDIASHQPHPPGYILFVGLGYLVNLVLKDPNRAFITLSIAASMIGAVAMYRLGEETFGHWEGVAAALLFVFSPLIWFYGEVGALYAVEPALVAVVLLTCRRARQGEPRAAFLSAFTLGVAGGVRQTTMLFLFPVWLYAVWPRRRPWEDIRRTWLRFGMALAVLGVIVVAWAAPLLQFAGGAQTYFAELRALSKLDSLQTSVVYRGLGVLPQNTVRVVAGLFNGLQAGAVLYVLWALRLFPYRPEGNDVAGATGGAAADSGRSRPVATTTGLSRAFVALSLLPAAAYFLFVHLGQLGYTAVLLPIFILYLPLLTHSFVADLSLRIARQQPFGLRRLDVARGRDVALGILLILNITGFLCSTIPVSRWGLEQRNERWTTVDRVVRASAPEGTVLLTTLEDLDSFRHLLYYAPNYHVYAVETSARRADGWRFEAFARHSNYGFANLPPLEQEIAQPSGITRLLVFDDNLASLMTGWQEARRWSLPESRFIYEYVAPNGTARGLVVTQGLVKPLEDG